MTVRVYDAAARSFVNKKELVLQTDGSFRAEELNTSVESPKVAP
jgi:hypothetical protein